jgi:ABC-type Fe3+-hydroxamate transport system substrate-binding protein
MPPYGLRLLTFLLIISCAQDGEATRIVSLAPVATEFLFALGLSDQIVGVTTYCDRPTAANKIAKIGGFADPQLEAIIKLRPDLVVATPYGAAKSVVDVLNGRGIQTVAQPVETLEQMKSFLAALGKATGKVQQAQELQTKFNSQFATFRNHFKSAPRVLILLSASPLIAAGPKSFPGQILTHVGATNAASSSSAEWPVLSLENLMREPPDIIVVSNGEKELEPTRVHLKPLLLKYPHRIRFFAPKQTLLQRPGPYLNDDIAELLKGLVAPHV